MNKTIVTISGMPGAGKSTVSKILAEKLRMKRYYMGGLIRELAQKEGKTLQEFYNNNEDIDQKIDDYQSEIGKEQDHFIMEGRTSFHFLPHSVKIYLNVNILEGAKRILKDTKENPDRNENKYETEEEAVESIVQRLAQEKEHYEKYYQIDVHDHNHYDFVLDTTDLEVEDVAKRLLSFIHSYR